MKESTKEFLDEFFEEFQDRIDALATHDEGVRKELLFLLVENLILKYENRMQLQKKGVLARLFPFLANSDYDEEFEKHINDQIEHLIKNHDISIPNPRQNGFTNDLIGKNFTEIQHREELKNNHENIVNHPAVNPLLLAESPQEFDQDSTPFSSQAKVTKFSKTNIPKHLDLALELNLLPNKEQDHLDYFVLENGVSGIILCDGVSGDGEFSAELAQSLPRNIIKQIEENFQSDISLSSWKQMVIESIEFALKQYEYDKGASTLLIAIIDPHEEQIYVSWMGDGNLIYFNETMTGFSKLLTPHNDAKGRLTRAVTATGLMGEPSVQIISGKGGAIIISSDGYNLANGRILKHFFQQVLRVPDIKAGLHTWTLSACCEQEQLHPKATDDRSIGVIRWNTVFNQYQSSKMEADN